MGREGETSSMRYEGNLIRPPAEARSVILQVTVGCSHNRCRFCGTYPYPFRVRPMAELLEDLNGLAAMRPGARRVFLADGDVLGLPQPLLLELLEAMATRFPKLGRVGVYGTARDVARKTDDELAALARLGLRTVYMGLESGSDAVLAAVEKGATADEMVRAVHRLGNAGLRVSVMALLGLGGKVRSREHAVDTGRVLGRMNAAYTSLLALTVLPGTPLAEDVRAGRFEPLDDDGMLRELRCILEELRCERTIFRANHASNPLPLEGSLPRDRERLLAEVDAALAGRRGLVPALFRGL